MLRLLCSTRLEKQIQDTQGKLEQKKSEIIQIQAAAQAQGPPPGKQAVAA